MSKTKQNLKIDSVIITRVVIIFSVLIIGLVVAGIIAGFVDKNQKHIECSKIIVDADKSQE